MTPYLYLALIVVTDMIAAFKNASAGPAPAGTPRDRDSLGYLLRLSLGGVLVALVLYHTAAISPRLDALLRPWALGGWAAYAAPILVVAGVALRFWSIVSLGPLFKCVIEVAPSQPVVERGPYRLLRHPSYSGSILSGIGFGLALGNWLFLALIAVPAAIGFGHRIRVEEEALLELIGEPYRSYMDRTKRLVPFVF